MYAFVSMKVRDSAHSHQDEGQFVLGGLDFSSDFSSSFDHVPYFLLQSQLLCGIGCVVDSARMWTSSHRMDDSADHVKLAEIIENPRIPSESRSKDSPQDLCV